MAENKVIVHSKYKVAQISNGLQICCVCSLRQQGALSSHSEYVKQSLVCLKTPMSKPSKSSLTWSVFFAKVTSELLGHS